MLPTYTTRSIGITEKLAEYAVSLNEKDVTSDVLHAARRCLLDWMGVTLGGSKYNGAQIILKSWEITGGHRDSTVIGTDRHVDILTAALANGYMAHVMDFDDTHIEAMLHPSAPIWSAIAAVSEKKNKNGLEALIAYISGYEVGTRIGRVLYPHHDERGWHISGLVGGIGATVAVGKLLDLNQKQMQCAIGIAASYGSGLRCHHGTMTKSLHPGKAAQSGVYAALLAKEGFTSSLNSLEADRGFFEVNAGEYDLDEVIANLGEGYEIFNNSVKPYACGVIQHPLIDASIKLKERGVDINEVIEIVAHVCPMVPDATGIKDPQTGLEGKFSAPHCIAVSLVDGHCEHTQFTKERVQDPLVRSLRQKVKLEVEPSFREWETTVKIVTNNGEVHECNIPFARGTKDNPLSDRELEVKYFSLANEILGEQKATDLVEQIWNLDENTSFIRFMKLTQK